MEGCVLEGVSPTLTHPASLYKLAWSIILLVFIRLF